MQPMSRKVLQVPAFTCDADQDEYNALQEGSRQSLFVWYLGTHAGVDGVSSTYPAQRHIWHQRGIGGAGGDAAARDVHAGFVGPLHGGVVATRLNAQHVVDKEGVRAELNRHHLLQKDQ